MAFSCVGAQTGYLGGQAWRGEVSWWCIWPISWDFQQLRSFPKHLTHSFMTICLRRALTDKCTINAIQLDVCFWFGIFRPREQEKHSHWLENNLWRFNTTVKTVKPFLLYMRAQKHCPSSPLLSACLPQQLCCRLHKHEAASTISSSLWRTL